MFAKSTSHAPTRKPIVAVIGLLTVASVSLAGADDWPQWRGPNRDGRSLETGLLAAWPAGGPPVIWRATGVGEGYSGVAVVGDRLYTQGQRASRGYVMAFDVRTGGKLWETPAGGAFNESRGNGPRGTPTVDGDRLYAMAADGTVVCLDAATGRTIWSQNVVQKYGGQVNPWGMSESPLVDGGRLIVTPGGRGATIVALNTMDGALIWKGGDDGAAYSSPIIGEGGGVRHVVTLTADAAIGVDAGTGRRLWRYTKVANFTANVATPVYHNGHVFVSSDYGTGGALLRLTASGASEVYFTRDMKNHYSTSVLVDDVLYGFNGSILTALRFMTGEVIWRHRSVGKGSVVYADKHLYVLGEDGVLGLVQATPSGYVELSRFEIPVSRYPTWAPPVIANGTMFVREQDRLVAFDIRAHAR
jgi:outer membrane protein assembly factor BamB